MSLLRSPRWSSTASFVRPRRACQQTGRRLLTSGEGDSMTLSLISLLSQDVTALWLLLKTSAGVSVCCVPVFRGTSECAVDVL